MIGYLPQHTSEALAVAVAIGSMCFSVPALIRGRSNGAPEGWTPTRVRLVAAFGIALVTGWVVLSFLVNAEPPGGTGGGHWGSTRYRILLGVWIAGIAGLVAHSLWKERRR